MTRLNESKSCDVPFRDFDVAGRIELLKFLCDEILNEALFNEEYAKLEEDFNLKTALFNSNIDVLCDLNIIDKLTSKEELGKISKDLNEKKFLFFSKNI